MALDNAFPVPSNNLTSATQWEELFALIGSGVIPGVGNEFVPSINSGSRQVIIDTGQAALRGFFVNGSSTTATGVPTASANPRIDRLVLRLDRTASTPPNWVKPVVITGTPAASNPQPPVISSSLTTQWDLPVCRYQANTDGSLSGLVDERYWLAGPTARMTSGARPSPAPPRLGIESDTSRVLWSDGSTWHGITQDTGWVDMSLASSYTQGNTHLATRVVNGVAYIDGDVVNPVLIYQNIVIGLLPAAAVPGRNIRLLLYQDGGTLLLGVAYTNGQFILTGNVGAATASAGVHVSGCWPVG